MPDLSAYLTSIRADGYTYTGYLSWVTPATVLEGTVSEDAAEPLFNVKYTTTGGAYTAVEVDMEVEIFSSGGDSKGRVRVALGGTLSATNLPVNEVSRGRIQIMAGDTLKVYREWRVRDRLVGQSKSFPKDSRLEYSASGDAGDNPAPITCSGGNWAGEVDSGQTYATVVTDGSGSATVDPDSAGAGTHLWTLVTGVAFAPGSASSDASPTLRVNAGSYVIRHRFTDNTNSVSSDQYVHLRCQNANDPATPIIMESLDLDDAGEARASFRTRGTTTISALPDGQMVFYWEKERRGGAALSVGNKYPARSHIKFIGFLVRDSIQLDATTNEVTFEAVGVIGILEQLPGFSQVLTNTTNATSWTKIKTLTVLRAVVYLIRYGTTAFRVFDFEYDAYNPLYAELFIQSNTPLAQVNELADGVDARFVADRTGNLEINRRLELETSANRTAAVTTLSLTTTDKITFNGAREHRYRVGQLIAYGFKAGTSGNVPAISVSPGNAPAESPASEDVQRLIYTTPTSLNERAGWRFAASNSTYNGLPSIQEIEIELRGSYDVFDPAYSEWVKLTLAGTTNRRGYSLSAARCILKAVSLSYDPTTGGKVVRLRLNQETIGAAGVSRRVVNQTDSNIGEYTLPEYDFGSLFAIIPTAPTVATGYNNLCLIMSDGHLRRTFNFASDMPVWDDFDLSATVGADVQQWVVDATNGSNGWAITGTGVFKLTGIFDTTPSAVSQLAISPAAGSANADFSFGAGGAGLFGVVAFRTAGRTRTYYTVDGTTWSSNTDITGTVPGSGLPGCFINSNDGRPYVGAPSVTGGTGYFTIWQGSSGLGTGWVEKGSSNGSANPYATSPDEMVSTIYMPYADKTCKTIYHSYINGGVNPLDSRLYRYTLGGGAAAWVDISYNDGAQSFAPSIVGRFTLSMPTASLNHLAYVGYNDASNEYCIAVTANARATSPTYTVVLPTTSSTDYRRLFMNDSYDLITFGNNGAIGFCPQPLSGGTIIDKKGALSTVASVVGVAGR